MVHLGNTGSLPEDPFVGYRQRRSLSATSLFYCRPLNTTLFSTMVKILLLVLEYILSVTMEKTTIVLMYWLLAQIRYSWDMSDFHVVSAHLRPF